MIADDGSEVRLVGQWRSGDKIAGNLLMRRYGPTLKAFFRSKRAHNVDELVQNTLVACIQAVARFAGRSSFKTYLLGIARNQFLMSLRSHQTAHLESSMLSTAPEDSPSRLYSIEQERRVLLGAFLRLPPEFRKVLRLFYWDGCSIEEIALELRVPLGTVKSRLSRGRAILKAQLLTRDLPSEEDPKIRTSG